MKRKRPNGNVARRVKLSAAHVATFRDSFIEDWLLNALECLLNGDGLNERDRAILHRVLQRVAMSALMTKAYEDERVKEQVKVRAIGAKERP
jgi:hypothetical protein